MKRVVVLFIFFCSLVRAEEPSAWSGLWVIKQQTSEQPQTLYLHISDEKAMPVLYSTNWKEETISDWRIGGEQLFLNWQFKSFSIAFEGRRDEDKVSGHWKAVHPQYRLENAFTAEHVFSEPEWSPEGAVVALGSRSGFADVSSFLLERAEEGKDAFNEFWEKQFIVDYFAFRPGAPSSEALFEVLSGSDFPGAARTFSESFGRLSERVSQRLAGIEFNLLLVSLPYGEPEAVNETVHGGLFVLVNPKGFIDREDPLEYEIEMAHKLFKSFLVGYLRLGRQQSSRFFHEGVASYLTSLLGYSEDPARFLLIQKEEIESFEARREDYLKRIGEEDPSVPLPVWKYFSYDFVKGLMEGKDLTQVGNYYPGSVESAFRKYVQGKQESNSAPRTP